MFIETIKKETLEQLRSFLSEHSSNDIDYGTWRVAVELRRKAFEEVYESTAAFREEFDKIIEGLTKRLKVSSASYILIYYFRKHQCADLIQ